MGSSSVPGPGAEPHASHDRGLTVLRIGNDAPAEPDEGESALTTDGHTSRRESNTESVPRPDVYGARRRRKKLSRTRPLSTSGMLP